MKHKLVDARYPDGASISLSESEYSEIVLAQTRVYEALAIEEKFDLLFRSYFDFERMLHEIALTNQLFQPIDFTGMVQQLQSANLALMNLLSMCRTFVDHVPHHVSELFGRESRESQELKSWLAEEYDGKLGYRVLYALRNYVQHRGFPIHYVTTGWKMGRGKDGVHLKHSATPYLSVEQLAEEPKFKKQILAELQQIGERVNLTVLVRENMSSFARINMKIRKNVASGWTAWQRTLVGTYERCCEQLRSKTNEYIAVKEGTSRHLILELGLVERLRYLLHKNERIGALEASFVTGQSEA